MKILATALFAALPGLAAAQCPTAADLEGSGIVLTHEDGATERFYREAPGLVRTITQFPEGYGGNNLLGQGIHLVQLVSTENGLPQPDTMADFKYPMGPTELPVPEAGLTWDIEYELNEAGYVTTERQSQVWGQPREISFGDCSYTGIPGKIDYLYQDGGSHQEGLVYLPELGIGYLIFWVDPYMDQPDVYTVVDIQVEG